MPALKLCGNALQLGGRDVLREEAVVDVERGEQAAAGLVARAGQVDLQAQEVQDGAVEELGQQRRIGREVLLEERRVARQELLEQRGIGG